jgi:hypothetical protein
VLGLGRREVGERSDGVGLALPPGGIRPARVSWDVLGSNYVPILLPFMFLKAEKERADGAEVGDARPT